MTRVAFEFKGLPPLLSLRAFHRLSEQLSFNVKDAVKEDALLALSPFRFRALQLIPLNLNPLKSTRSYAASESGRASLRSPCPACVMTCLGQGIGRATYAQRTADLPALLLGHSRRRVPDSPNPSCNVTISLPVAHYG